VTREPFLRTRSGRVSLLAMHPVFRTVAMGEALTGQLYLAVLIARFANSAMRAPRGGDDAG